MLLATTGRPIVGRRAEEVEATLEDIAVRPASVAVVGTLAEFRPEPVPHDLGELVRFVTAIAPDLLCLDMTLDQWARRDFGGLPAEYREALLPLASQTDIVVVPIGDGANMQAAGDDRERVPPGLRGWLHRRLRATVARLQDGIGSPVAVGEGLRHTLVEHLLYLVDRLERSPMPKRAAQHREVLTERIVELARRDPDRRILVVVNARHCHQLRNALRSHREVALVSYSDL